MHPLAARQRRRLVTGELVADPRIEALFVAISDAYVAADQDRELLERTLALASRETEDRYHALRADVARREEAERERDAFFRVSPDMMCIVDARMRLVQVNESWTTVLGFTPEALHGTSLRDLTHADDFARLSEQYARILSTGAMRDFELRLKTSTGSWKWVSAGATIDRQRNLFFGVMRDVTEQRAMARELAQAQKLEAVGQLASGVAHEINTPVQYVSDNVSFAADSVVALFGYVDAMTATLTPEQKASLEDAKETAEIDYFRDEAPRALSEALEGVRRVAELVRALKEFAHADAPEKAPADLNKCLERTVVLARGELKHHSRVATDFGKLPMLDCHASSLSQVFLNLLVNAGHAVEERTLKEGVPFERHLIGVKTRHENDEIVITISDTGCGMPDSVKERLYEPFFTTKPVGKGSGQGLPLVRSVIDRHGGRIDVESTVSVGTTFTLRLPMHTPIRRNEAA